MVTTRPVFSKVIIYNNSWYRNKDLWMETSQKKKYNSWQGKGIVNNSIC